jgi:uncharacterized membrane protein required for colicin V production
VDLAALALILWSAVKGYFTGVYHAFLYLCGLCTALWVSVIFQNSFTLYLNQEWKAEAIFVDILVKQNSIPLKTGAFNSLPLQLPYLTGRLTDSQWMAGPVLTVSGDFAPALLAAMLVRLLALFLFFLFLATVITLLLRIKQYNEKENIVNTPEWQKALGLLFGACQGLMLAVAICLALDAIAFALQFGLLQHDLNHSYLYLFTTFLVQKLAKL